MSAGRPHHEPRHEATTLPVLTAVACVTLLAVAGLMGALGLG